MTASWGGDFPGPSRHDPAIARRLEVLRWRERGYHPAQYAHLLADDDGYIPEVTPPTRHAAPRHAQVAPDTAAAIRILRTEGRNPYTEPEPAPSTSGVEWWGALPVAALDPPRRNGRGADPAVVLLAVVVALAACLLAVLLPDLLRWGVGLLLRLGGE